MKYSTPILFLIFNRPDVTNIIFDRIREIQPEFLFIAADGPRPDKLGEKDLCEQTRSIVDRVDWPCTVKTLLRTENLGCAKGVSSAINWFFQHVEQGIILEDDCLPDLTFFSFCEELLERYKQDKEIGAICGFNAQLGIPRTRSSYYFSRLPSSWGWATWADRWNEYNNTGDVPSEQILNQRDIIHLKQEILDTFSGKIDSWGYRWLYTFVMHKFTGVYPSVSLIKNLGFSEDATHTKGQRWWYKYIQYGNIAHISHPRVRKISDEADRFRIQLEMNILPGIFSRIQFKWYRWYNSL